jgi:Protein of unknown function (DUF3102)
MMNTVVSIGSVGSNFLTSLAADIRLHHEEAERAAKTQEEAGQSKLEYSIKAGKALIEAKEVLTPTGGSWLKWLKINFTFTARTAQQYMKLAMNADKIRSTASHHSIRSAFKVIAGSKDDAVPSRPKAPRTISDSHKDAVRAATGGRIKAKRRNPGSDPIKQNFIPNIPGYLEEMLLTMERCVVEYEITPVEATAKAIIAHRIKVEHFDQIIDWLTQLKHTVHQTSAVEEAHERKKT